MIRAMLPCVALMLSSPAAAQVVTSAADTAALQSQITTAKQAADAAAIAATSACQPMATLPPPEVVGGAVGSGTACRLANSIQPRITRSKAFTTDSSGLATVTWTDMGAVPLVFVVPNVATGAGQAPACYPVTGSITSGGVQVKCYTTQSVTVSLLGAVVAPLTTAGAGVTGQVLAIPAS